jgi:UDP-N-acetyl-2-amino-2-deoxyglucuronate dehydrogenase
MAFHVGLLGAGGISETHARAARSLGGVVVAAVYGGNAEKVRRLASEYGAVACDDLEQFLAHRPMDAVVIGSPSGLHAEQGGRAAAAGLHVLVEKPIDVTLERADALIGAASRAGVRLGVLFQDRVQPSLAALRNVLSAGELGRVLLVSARVKWYRPPEYYTGSRWRGTRALDGGGALMNQGIHTLDLLAWLLGPVRRVFARAATLRHAIEVEDTLVATLEFESGALGTFEATTAAYPGYPRRVELTTETGTVIVEQNRIVAADLSHPASALPVDAVVDGNLSAASPIVADVSGHAALLADFVDAVRARRDPVCGGEEARGSLAIALAMYESARRCAAVEVEGRR